ncbi:MAG TPA: SCO family protein [Candidatus Limnocylindrales bacterium]|nr:SCO family protein [Candidatus Limnocylindrales bacterium]
MKLPILAGAGVLLLLAACAPAPTPEPLTLAAAAPTTSFAIPTEDGLPGDQIAPPLQLQDFTLPASTGEDLSLSEITGTGKWTMIYFGYLHCPDFCPTTLAEFTRVQELMGEAAEQVQLVFVSVDGQRDTPELLATYLRNFDPAFIGLQGNDETLAEIQPDYGFFYERRTDTGSAAAYLVDHSTRSYLIDPQGRLRLSFTYDTGPKEIAQAIQAYMALSG